MRMKPPPRWTLGVRCERELTRADEINRLDRHIWGGEALSNPAEIENCNSREQYLASSLSIVSSGRSLSRQIWRGPRQPRKTGKVHFAFIIRFLFAVIRCPAMDRRARLILVAAAVIVASRLRELKDSPALRPAVIDAIRVAEHIAKSVDNRDSVRKPS